jgi:hypothetical protein
MHVRLANYGRPDHGGSELESAEAAMSVPDGESRIWHRRGPELDTNASQSDVSWCLEFDTAHAVTPRSAAHFVASAWSSRPKGVSCLHR